MILHWALLNILTKRRYDALIEQYGSLEEAWKHINPTLLKELGCKEETVERVMNQKDGLDIEEHQSFMEKKGITFISIEDEAYPAVLRNLPDPPVFLFYRGDLRVLDTPSIAIVGTRNMSAYGKRVVEAMVPDFVHAGLITVSGLALGIDAEVAKETIAAGGKTVAVLGGGLHHVYPKTNAKLAEEIVEHGGLLLTEYPLHIWPDKYTFPARNRIIAGLSLGTIVVEAANQSGSLITASLALDYGKEVFAVPGPVFDPNMAGTHQLIQKSGAKLIGSVDDVLIELGMVTPEKDEVSAYAAETPNEQTLLDALTSMPQTVNELTEKTGMTVATTNATLTLMELKRGARNTGMGQWVK